MKLKSLSILVMILAIMTSSFGQSPTSNRNYVMETTVKVAGKKNLSQLASLPIDSANRTISYFDGLGRPLQQVKWQASPSKRDIVQLMIYDELGREAIKYLPYAEQSSDNGSFKTSAISNQAEFYGTSSWDANVVRTTRPYLKTVFEASPLNRVLEQGAPGTTWQPYSSMISNSGHTVKTLQAFNSTNEVALWTCTSTGASAISDYGPNKLYKSIVKNENWTSGKTGTVEEFHDTDGKLILKRLWEDESISLSTYYIYDVFNNLRYVIPPAVTVASFSETDAVFKNFIYGYHHDGRKRVIEKKIPSKGWEYIVYNSLDQTVLTQDSIQRANSKWSFIKYDALERVVLTGLLSSSSSRNAWQTSIDGQTYLWEAKDNSNASGTATGYSNVSLPTTSIDEYFVLNYYDDYDFYGNSFGTPVSPQVGGGRTRGLQTGKRVNTLGTTTKLLTVNYYDDEGRLLQSKSENHLGGTDAETIAYSFTGEVLSSNRINVTNSVTTTIANTYTYDHVGRKISAKKNINSQGEVVLNKNEYNEIGLLKKKSLHSTDGGSTFLQNTKYSYNPRNWLTGKTSTEFSIRLGYDTTSTPQYNGNISTQLWGAGYANKFLYSYDALSRLKSAISTGVSMSEILDYDVMGNISHLSRDGGTNAIYTYIGNKLDKINNGPLATGYYDYDANGNATTDGRNGVTLTYNYLNLPITATKSGLSLSYTYDATGEKLKKTNSTIGTITDYINGIQFTNGTVDFILTEEGIARNNGGTYTYEYNLTDHLGNVRYSFNKHPSTGLLQQLQADDYYGFGLKKTSMGGTNSYLYNGKEIQPELGLTSDDGQYDYGARFYDPVIGRWNVIDPMAEKFYSVSPYIFAINNPIKFIDPEGMDVKETESGTYYDGEDAINKFKELQAKLGISNQNDDNNENNPEEPIDLFGSHEKKNSSFHKTADNFEWEEGDGNFYVMAHANLKAIFAYDDKGNSQKFTDPKAFSDFLKTKSKAYKKAMEEGKSITLTLYACNTASTEQVGENGQMHKIANGLEFARRFSKKFSNVTVIAPDGFCLYYNTDKGGIAGAANHRGDAGFVTFRDGKKITKEQTQTEKPVNITYKKKL